MCKHVSIPLTGQSLDECFLNKSISTYGVELIRIYSKEGIRVVQELRVLHLQFHVLQELLVGWYFFYNEFHILAIALHHSIGIYTSTV